MKSESSIRVMIVEDSAVVRMMLEHIIGQDQRLQVVASVSSGEEALKVIHRAAPDVISLDIRLPGIDGLETTRRIMAERPTPIVVVSASVEREDLQISMNALRAGALTVLEKPPGTSHSSYQAMAQRLCTQLVIMSQVKVVRQRPAPVPARRKGEPVGRRRASPPRERLALLGVVASTGGPRALVELFNGLGADFPLPICLVQHMTASFLDGFVDWLSNVCPQKARLASDGMVPSPGSIYLAPSEHHLLVEDHCLRLDGTRPSVCGQRPSGTVLFESMAHSLGTRALGVLLTGMGDDGALGLLRIKEAGGITLAQDESSSVVYGMPAAAVRIGGVQESLPLSEMAPRIRGLIEREKAGI